MKILVIKFRNIGDVLLTAPLFENLKLNYPDAMIDAAVNKGTEEMLAGNPFVNKIHMYDRERIKKLPFIKRMVEEMKFIFSIRSERYEMVINTTRGDRGALLSLISGAETKIGYPVKNSILKKAFTHTLPEQGMRHTVEMNLDALRVLDKKIYSKKVKIFCEDKDNVCIDKILSKFSLQSNGYVHFHPVSRWLFKCIDDKMAARIIDYVQDEFNIPVVITAAPVDKELEGIKQIKSHCSTHPIDLGGQLTLKETAALSSKSRFFIGVDTAIMHMAAANNKPVLASFGPSGAFHWGPWDNNCQKSGYTARSGFQTMGMHKVYSLEWDCIPCGRDGCNGTKISDCLVQMDTNFIKKCIRDMISSDNLYDT